MKITTKILFATLIISIYSKIGSCVITLVNDGTEPELFVNTQKSNKEALMLMPQQSMVIGDSMDHAHFNRYKMREHNRFEPFQTVAQHTCAPGHKITLKTSDIDSCSNRPMCSLDYFAVSPIRKESSLQRHTMHKEGHTPSLPRISPAFRMHKPENN